MSKNNKRKKESQSSDGALLVRYSTAELIEPALVQLQLLEDVEGDIERECVCDRLTEYTSEKIASVVEHLNDPERLELLDHNQFEKCYRDSIFVIRIIDLFRSSEPGLFEIISDGENLSLSAMLNLLRGGSRVDFLQSIKPILLASAEEELEIFMDALFQRDGLKLNDIKSMFDRDPKRMNSLYEYIGRRGFSIEQNERKRESRKPNDVADALREWKKPESRYRCINSYALKTQECMNRIRALNIVLSEKRAVYTGLQSARSQGIMMLAATGLDEPANYESLVSNGYQLPVDARLVGYAVKVVNEIRNGTSDVEKIDALAQSIDGRFLLKYMSGGLAADILEQGGKILTSKAYRFTGELEGSLRTLLLYIGENIFDVDLAKDSPEKILSVVKKKIKVEELDDQFRDDVKSAIVSGMILYLQDLDKWSDDEISLLSRLMFDLIEEHASAPDAYLMEIKYPDGVGAIGDLADIFYTETPSLAVKFLATQISGAVSNSYTYGPDGTDPYIKSPLNLIRRWFLSDEAKNVSQIPVMPIPQRISPFGRMVLEKTYAASNCELVTALRLYIFEHENVYPNSPYPRTLLQILPLDLEQMGLDEVMRVCQNIGRVSERAWIDASHEEIMSTSYKLTGGQHPKKKHNLEAVETISRKISDTFLEGFLVKLFAGLKIPNSKILEISPDDKESFREFMRLQFAEEDDGKFFLQAASEDEYRVVLELLGDRDKKVVRYSTIGNEFLSSENILTTSRELLGESEQTDILARNVYRRLLFILYQVYTTQGSFAVRGNDLTELIGFGYLLGEHAALIPFQREQFNSLWNGAIGYQLIPSDQQTRNFGSIHNQRGLIRESNHEVTDIMKKIAALEEEVKYLSHYDRTVQFVRYADTVAHQGIGHVIQIPEEMEDIVVARFSSLLPGLNKQALLTTATILISSGLHDNLELVNEEHRSLSEAVSKDSSAIIAEINRVWSEIQQISGCEVGYEIGQPEPLGYEIGQPEPLGYASVLQSLPNESLLARFNQIKTSFAKLKKEIETRGVQTQIGYWTSAVNDLEKHLEGFENLAAMVERMSRQNKTMVRKSNKLSEEESLKRVRFWIEIIDLIRRVQFSGPVQVALPVQIESRLSTELQIVKNGIENELMSHPLFRALEQLRGEIGDEVLKSILLTLLPERDLPALDDGLTLLEALNKSKKGDLALLLTNSGKLLQFIQNLGGKLDFIKSALAEIEAMKTEEAGVEDLAAFEPDLKSKAILPKKPKRHSREIRTSARRRHGIVFTDDDEHYA